MKRFDSYFFCMMASLVLLVSGCMSDERAPVVSASIEINDKAPFYRVKPGDTLYSIAWAYNLDYRTLLSINHLPLDAKIHPGQRIRLKAISVRLTTQLQSQHTVIVQQKIVAPTFKTIQLAPTVLHWRWPAIGRVVSRFTQYHGGNQGIDIAGRYQSAVVAANSGVVVYSGFGVRGYGNLIIIKHNASYLSAYAFNRRILVKDGSRVRIGQKIAEMGRDDSGRVVLHFEIRRNGKPVNPLSYLR